MDLGISGRTALVCGSSAGLGRACAEALAAEGVLVVLNGRDSDRLEQARVALSTRYSGVRAVAADVATPDGRARLLEACPAPDILVNNAGGPERRAFADTTHAAWLAAIEANMLAPILLMQALLPGMRARHWGRIVNITSAMVTTPRPDLELSAAPRAGLTAVVRALALASAVDNVTINNLLPEKFATERNDRMAASIARRDGITPDESARRIAASIAAKRRGRPEELGQACAFLCGAQSGYISGQNLRLDGGSYPGLI